MKATHVYFPPTTPQQRKLLFETWEQTDNVTKACQKARVGRATFSYWKPRFDKDGYAGLETYEKTGVPKEQDVYQLRAKPKYWICMTNMLTGANIACPMK